MGTRAIYIFESANEEVAVYKHYDAIDFIYIICHACHACHANKSIS